MPAMITSVDRLGFDFAGRARPPLAGRDQVRKPRPRGREIIDGRASEISKVRALRRYVSELLGYFAVRHGRRETLAKRGYRRGNRHLHKQPARCCGAAIDFSKAYRHVE